MRDKIQNILNEIKSNYCGEYELENIEEQSNTVFIILKEIVGVIDNSREYHLRNDILSKIIDLFENKKVEIEIS